MHWVILLYTLPIITCVSRVCTLDARSTTTRDCVSSNIQLAEMRTPAQTAKETGSACSAYVTDGRRSAVEAGYAKRRRPAFCEWQPGSRGPWVCRTWRLGPELVGVPGIQKKRRTRGHRGGEDGARLRPRSLSRGGSAASSAALRACSSDSSSAEADDTRRGGVDALELGPDVGAPCSFLSRSTILVRLLIIMSIIARRCPAGPARPAVRRLQLCLEDRTLRNPAPHLNRSFFRFGER